MRKIAKRLGALVLAAALAVTMLPSTGLKSYAADNEVTGYTATELTKMFSMGFNIGNSLDARDGMKSKLLSQETSWGNPAISKELMHGIAEAGYTIVRIPITWEKHIAKDENDTIDEEWLAHIKEVVDMALDEGLFVIINVHHDNTWLNIPKLSTEYKTIGKKLGHVWSQIADYFADYDQKLIFESMNEPRAIGTDYEWTGTVECYKAINYLNQVFVDAVRGNGKGHNGERALMIPGYAASNSHAVLTSIEIPTWKGKQAENVIVAVHCYSPYDFCLSDNQIDFDVNREADTTDVTRMFRDFKTLFLDKGIPVILGECGATRQGDNVSEREEYFDWFGKLCRQYGVPACVWDNGANGKTGGENHSYISRKTGEMTYPTLVEAFIKGTPLQNLYIDFEPVSISGKATVKSPYDLGFTPTGIMGRMKVNHTEGVAMGYSAQIDTKDGAAYLDISAYQGLKVKITAYVQSEDDVVIMGLSYDGKTEEYTNVTTKNEEWKGMGFAVELPKASDLSIYFKGNDGVKYYIDDVSVEIVDSLDGITFEFTDTVSENKDTTAETETSVSASTETSTASSVSASVSSSTTSTTTNVNQEEKMKTIMWVGTGIFVLAVVVMIAAFILSKYSRREDD